MQSDNALLMSEMKKKRKKESPNIASEIKREENYLKFGKFGHVIQHGLQEFIVKSIEGESTERKDLSHIL